MAKVVLYHARCPDGLGGAASAYLALGEMNTEYVPVIHNCPLPNSCVGKDVYFIDIILSKKEMIKACNVCKSVTVLDHHETAFRNLEGVPISSNSVLNKEKSGCMIAWEFFHPYKRIPPVIWRLQDYDLWQFKFTDTKFLNAYITSCVDYNHRAYADNLLKEDLSTEIMMGQILHIKMEKDVENICENMCKGKYTDKDGNVYNVAIVNSSTLQSLCGDFLVKNNYDIDFAVVWFYCGKSNAYRYSIRGNGKLNLSMIAEENGGGGHHNASGFTSAKPFNEIYNV